MTRIAMISEHASPLGALGGTDGGGQNVYVAQLSRELAAMGHVVDIFTRREDPAQPRIVAIEPGVRVVHVDAGPAEVLPKEQLLGLMDAFTDDMAAFIAGEGGYDLIHAHFFMSGLVAVELKRRLGVPVVTTFHALGRVRRMHQGEADGFPDARFAIEDRIVAESDRVIAECPEDERDLMGLYAADPLKLRMIPCGVDMDAFVPGDKRAARLRLGLDPDEPIVLQLGRMVRRKGVDDAIRGFARATADGRAGRLLVVGGANEVPDPASEPEFARLMAVAEEEGASDRVNFVGRRGRAELPDYFAAADLFVTAPWYEPFGITPLEAMACARPVIASDVGGLRYSVEDRVTGLRVPTHDPDALARAIAHLLKAPHRAQDMGVRGRERVAALFTWRAVALQMAEVYRETLAKAVPAVSAADDDPIASAFAGLAEVAQRGHSVLAPAIRAAADTIADCLLRGGKVLVCGNGGSAAEAQHFAAEFVGRFKDPDRRALPVIALTADTAFLTAWANDYGFEDVFARGVRAYGQAGDVLVVLSTSGRSANIVKAMHEARARKLTNVALLGGALSPALPLADVAVSVPSADTARVQEMQLLSLHLICQLAEARVLAHDAPVAQPLIGAA